MNESNPIDHFLLDNCFGLPLETVFDLLPIGVFVIDKNYQYVFVNEKNATIHSKSKDELLGKCPYDFFPAIEDSLMSIFDQVFTTHEPIINREFECRRDSHSNLNQQKNKISNRNIEDVYFWSVCFSHQWDKDHKEQYILCTIEDITNLKYAEFHLHNQNQELQRIVEDRTKELKQKQKKLLQATRVMADREQDIKRHLAEKIHGNLQQLLVGAGIKANKIKRTNQDTNLQDHILELVDFLNQAAEEARSVSHQLSPPILEHTSFNQALEWLANSTEDHYGLSVKLNLDSGSNVVDERTKYYLFDSINELVLNCVKHANTDIVYISSKLLARQKLLINITDFGAGCDTQKIWRIEEDTSHFGLVNLQKRLELMGCTVNYWSEPGKGFQSKIYVPIEKLETTERVLEQEEQEFGITEPEKKPPKHIDKTRILVVDDHDMVREGIIGLLEDEYDLEIIGEAENGQVALKMVRTHQPDIVMMDVNMPKMDGIEATNEIMKEFPQTKVIGLSVNNDLTTRNAMLNAGAVDYIPKDKSSEELCELIRKLK